MRIWVTTRIVPIIMNGEHDKPMPPMATVVLTGCVVVCVLHGVFCLFCFRDDVGLSFGGEVKLWINGTSLGLPTNMTALGMQKRPHTLPQEGTQDTTTPKQESNHRMT